MLHRQKTKKNTSVKDATIALARYCAYQERSQSEVRQKLFKEYTLDEDEREEVIYNLIIEDFINEERFAKIFAGSKFRTKKWGRRKIKQALKLKGISPYCIKVGMKEIGEEDYFATLQTLLEKKHAQVLERNAFKLKAKLANYAIAKGYESYLVWEIINDLVPS